MTFLAEVQGLRAFRLSALVLHLLKNSVSCRAGGFWGGDSACRVHNLHAKSRFIEIIYLTRHEQTWHRVHHSSGNVSWHYDTTEI